MGNSRARVFALARINLACYPASGSEKAKIGGARCFLSMARNKAADRARGVQLSIDVLVWALRDHVPDSPKRAQWMERLQRDSEWYRRLALEIELDHEAFQWPPST